MSQPTPECPQCGETYYVSSQGFLDDGWEAWQCDICDIAWLVPPDDRQPTQQHAPLDLAWLEWHFTQRR